MNGDTATKNQLGAFREEMAKIGFDSKESKESYSAMLQDLDALVKETDRFYTKTNGEYPKMDEDSFDRFTRLYKNAFDSMKECCEVLSNQEGEKEKQDWAIQLMGAVQKFLGEDLVLLSSAKENGLSTLPEIIEQARTKVVDVTGQEISTVGANMSNRRKITVPGKDGNDSVRGFFTESVSSNEEMEQKALYERTIQKNPKMKELIAEIDKIDKQLKENEEEGAWRQFETCIKTLDNQVNLGAKDSMENYQKPEHVFDEYIPGEFDEETQKKFHTFFEKDNLVYPFMEYLKERDKIGNKYRVFYLAGIDNNNSLDERNSAMSFVADLLGMEGLIARAEPMILQNGDKKIRGTFMHYATGTDLSGIKLGDPLLRPDAEIDCSSNDLKKQVADLQILDYICGNTDRHGANLFYQIDDSDPKHPRITGIQGIDNDNSFGTITSSGAQLPSIRNMMVIREDTAKVIIGLNEDMLKTTLRNFNLSEEEIQAAWNRTKQIQDAIQDGMEFYKNQAPDMLDGQHLRIVKENEWQKFDIKDLAKKEQSYFSTVRSAQDNAATNYFEKEFAEVKKQYREVSIQVHDQKAGIKDLVKALETADQGVWRGSPEYGNLKRVAKTLERLHDGIYQEDFTAGARELKEAYKQTIEAADQYLNLKMNELNEKLKGKSEADKKKITDKFMDPKTTTGKRMAAVSALASQLKKYADQLNTMEELKEKNDKLKAISDGKSDKMEEIKKRMSKESVPQKHEERVRMTLDNLESAERPKRQNTVIKKAPETEKKLERRSLNPRSMG